jgi:Cu/Ag efflux pump CusA
MPITGPTPGVPPTLLATVASIQRGTGAAVVSHYNIMPTIDIFGAVQGRDLGGVSGDITRIIDQMRSKLPRGS